jgi:hypothetical protein
MCVDKSCLAEWMFRDTLKFADIGNAGEPLITWQMCANVRLLGIGDTRSWFSASKWMVILAA